MKKALLALAGFALLAAPALGDRLDPGAVPANSRYVVHVDLDGLQKTELWQTMLQMSEELDEDPFAELDAVEQEIGVHPLRDIHSVTLFSPRPDPEDAVAMIVGNTKIDTALNALDEMEQCKVVEMKQFRVRVIKEEGETGYVTAFRDGDRRILLVSKNKKELIRGSLVLIGEQPNLASVDHPPFSLKQRKGSFLFVACAGDLPGMMGVEPASELFDMARSFTFDLGESDGVLSARLAVATDSEQTAKRLTDVLEGVVAIAQLAVGMEELPEEVPVDLLESLHFGTRGKTVVLEFFYETAALVQLAMGMGAFD